MSNEVKRFYEFGDFRFDPIEQALYCGNARVSQGSKPLAVLQVLLERPGATISKKELMDKFWPSPESGETSLTQAISSLRKDLGDRADYPKFIMSVPGEGYRFIAEVKRVPAEKPRGLGWKSATLRVLLGACAVALVAVLAWTLSYRGRSGGVSSRAELLYKKAKEYERRGDDEEALTALNEAIMEDSNLAQAYLDAAAILQDIGEEEKASEMAANANKHSASLDGAAKLRLEGLTNEIHGDSERALETYRLLIDSYPRDVKGQFFFAALAMRQGRLEEADRSLQACLKLDRLNPDCHYERMFLEVRRNRFDDAVLETYEALHREKVGFPWFDEPAGIALWAKGDIDGALNDFQRLATARAGGIRVHGRIHRLTAQEWIADVRLYQGKFLEARRLLNKMVEDAPAREARAAKFTYLARIDALTGDATQAREQAERAERTSDDPATLAEVAEVLAMVGAREESLASLSKWKSTKRAQADPQASARESFVRGANSLSSGLAQKAIEELMLAVGDQEKPNPEAEYLLARAYIANGQWAEATRHLDRVIQAKGPLFLDDVPSIWPLAHYDMAECYRELGDDAKAASNYRNFLDVWKDADPGIRQIDIAKRWLKAQASEKSRTPRPRPKH